LKIDLNKFKVFKISNKNNQLILRHLNNKDVILMNIGNKKVILKEMNNKQFELFMKKISRKYTIKKMV
jgi:hypothetical protein